MLYCIVLQIVFEVNQKMFYFIKIYINNPIVNIFSICYNLYDAGVHIETVGIQKKVPGGDMSINKYDEQKFWEEVDILFPDIVKAITSLAKKSYISITNLRNGVTWWSEKAMEYFGMQENYTIRGQEKSKRSIHSDDLEESGQGTLLKIGLDQFSHINVMYGAAFSDKILNCAAQELLRLLKGKGYVYRLSGAKFVISFKKVSKEELQQIYDEIVEVFENTEVEGKKIPLKVSAGAIFMEPYMKETNAVRSRLTYALNHSRLEHHGELVIFNDEICGSDENQFELIGVIHQCATHNFEGFRMFYQPIADTKTGKIRGMEALLRWELEPYGMVSPGVFMEWLEQDPCIFDLGNWILRTALTDVQKLRKETEGFFVNVNVAAAQLERREFRSAVMNILKETGAKPEELCLELTERCRDLDIQFLRREVEFFHSQGIKIALDDSAQATVLKSGTGAAL